MTDTLLTAISWGCGVQSTTLVAMSALGDLPPVDVVVTADPGWERAATYQARDFYTAWLQERGIRVKIIKTGDIRELGAREHIHVPFWTADGGPLRQQCSRWFKITPIRRLLRVLAGLDATRPPHPPRGAIESWLGISWDEQQRANPSRVQFIRNRWPLLEMGMTRNDCIDYLHSKSLPVPVRSSCIGCPNRRASEWFDMKTNAPAEWEQAVEFDEENRHNPLAARHGSTADELFVYKHRVPLRSANLVADARRERTGRKIRLFLRQDIETLVSRAAG